MPTTRDVYMPRRLTALTTEETHQCDLLGVRLVHRDRLAVTCHYKGFIFYPVEVAGKRHFRVMWHDGTVVHPEGFPLAELEYEDLLDVIEAIDAI